MIKKKLFSQLDDDLKIEKCTLPQCVSVTKNPDDETFDQIVARQEKFLKLDEAIKDKLVSDETAKRIHNIGKQNNLDLLKIACIARGIRSYYFDEIKLEDLAEYFSKEIEIDIKTAQSISEYVIKNIIEDPSYIKSKIVQMSLAGAMQQYPKIEEQAISINLLKLRYFPAPVRPSIKNWITDFHDNMGAGKHSSLDRANYIFHSDNGKKLTPVERQKLSLILKSLEEKTPLSIDPEKQAVVFEQLSFGDKQSAIASQQTAVETKKPEIERKKAPKEEKDIFQRFNPAAGQKQMPSNFFPNFTKKKEIQEKPKTVENLHDKNYFRNIEKKSDIGSENYFGNFSSADLKKEVTKQEPIPRSNPIRFSSAQKFPVEQRNELIKKEKQVFDAEKNSPKPIDTKQPSQKFQWQLKPTSYSENNNAKYDIPDDESNYSGNIVNLKG